MWWSWYHYAMVNWRSDNGAHWRREIWASEEVNRQQLGVLERLDEIVAERRESDRFLSVMKDCRSHFPIINNVKCTCRGHYHIHFFTLDHPGVFVCCRYFHKNSNVFWVNTLITILMFSFLCGVTGVVSSEMFQLICSGVCMRVNRLVHLGQLYTPIKLFITAGCSLLQYLMMMLCVSPMWYHVVWSWVGHVVVSYMGDKGVELWLIIGPIEPLFADQVT